MGALQVPWAGCSVLWLLIDLAGPAYRVTLPSCIFIAYMRQKHLYSPESTDV